MNKATAIMDAFADDNPRYSAYLRAGGNREANHSYIAFIAVMKRAFPGTRHTGHYGKDHGVIQDHAAFTAFIETVVAEGRALATVNGQWVVEE